MKTKLTYYVFLVIAVLLVTGTVTLKVSAVEDEVQLQDKGIVDMGDFERGQSEEKLAKIIEKITQITQVLLYLISIYFVARMLMIIFSSQIELVGGKPGAIAGMATEMVYALLSFLVAIESPGLGQAFAHIASKNIETAVGSEIASVGGILEPIVGFIIGFLGTLVFTGFTVGFVFSGVRTLVTSAVGSPSGLSMAVSTGLSLLFSLFFGFAFLRVGQWIIQHNFSF